MSIQRIWMFALSAVAAASVCLVAAPVQDVVIRGVGLATPTISPDASTPAGTGVVLGRVVDAGTGRPVPGATVTIGSAAAAFMVGLSAQAPPTAMTNSAGYFMFRDLGKGSHPITVTARGYLNGANGQLQPDGPSRPVPLDDNGRVTDVVIRMWKHGVVSGTVRDERGEPLVGVNVRVLRRTAGRLASMMQSQTDDRGIYRISGLTPGDYYVAVLSSTGSIPASLAATLRQPASSAAMEARRDLPPGLTSLTFGGEGVRVGDSMLSTTGPSMNRVLMPQPGPDGRLTGYGSTYHPAAVTLAEAEAVRIASGDDRSDVDINVRLTPMLTVSGTVVGPTGPEAGIGITLVPGFLDGAGVLGIETAMTLAGQDGRFTLFGVAPGQYRLKAARIPRPAPTPIGSAGTMINLGSGGMLVMGSGQPELSPASELPTLWANVPVSVGDRDLTGVTLTLSTGSRIAGHVVFEGDTPPAAADTPRLGIGLVTADDRAEQMPPPAPVNQNTRQFLTAQYPAGRYLVNVTSLPSGWTVRSAVAGGMNIFERPLTLSGQDISGVVVTLTRQPTTLTGTVRRAAATGDPRALVAIIPADYRAWIDEGMANRRFRSAAVQPDGTFEFSGLGEGEYIVAAVGAEYPLDGKNVTTIDALARAGTRVAIRDGVNQTPTLTVATIR